jgi:hypothetical protein
MADAGLGIAVSRFPLPPSVEIPETSTRAVTSCDKSARAVVGWRRFVRSAVRIRRLQRYFGHIGQFLKSFSSEFRTSLTNIYEKQ